MLVVEGNELIQFSYKILRDYELQKLFSIT